MNRIRWILWGTVSSWLLLVAWAPQAWAGKKDPVELIQAQAEIPEESLIDVGIQLFNPGLPEDPLALGELSDKGIFIDVRKSEARYIPINLMRTLQSSGFWGAVRLVPAASSTDLMVSGTILKSNGKELKLKILAVDAMGKTWLDERYKREADLSAYMEGKFGLQDPYQSLYNQIANDLLKELRKKKSDYLREVHMISELRFARDLAPTAFGDYLKVDKKGRYEIEKLPAIEDPMMARLAGIRERDYMFIDTLNEHYADFYDRMDEPYDHWRAYSYEEQVALDKLRKAARLEKILGAAAIIGGIVASGKGGRSGRTAGEVAVIGGIAALQDGFAKSEESKMHAEALRELAASLDSDVAPLLVDVEGEVMRLTGSVETQYATWRQLLREIFASETGLPVDPNTQTPRDLVGPVKH
jgi:hypothetical protein